MPDIFQVGAVNAVQVSADAVNQTKISHAGGGTTLYYKSSADVSVASSDGSLTVGQSATLTGTTFLIASAASEIRVIANPTPTSSTTDVSASDDLTVGDDATITGDLAVSGVSSLAVAGSHGVPNVQVTTVTNGTDTAFADGTLFLSSIYLPHSKTLTGVGYLLGSVGGTDRVIVALYSTAGVQLAKSTVTASGTVAGTTAEIQKIAFTATYAATGPGTYYVGISANGNTAKLRTVPAFLGDHLHAGSVSLTHAATTAVTVPTTFTAAKAPYAFLY